MMNSERLKNFFKQNPKDLKVLKHDHELHVLQNQPHLKHMPDYIIPPSLKVIAKSGVSQDTDVKLAVVGNYDDGKAT